MKHCKMGNTGLSVSEIGPSCEEFVGKEEAFTDIKM